MTRLPSLLLVALALTVPYAAAIGPADPPPDDAGSGTDAPNVPPSPLRLVPGLYSGAFPLGDGWDWYSVVLSAGEVLHVEVHGVELCVHAHDASGILGRQCAGALRPASLWIQAVASGPIDLGVESSVTGGYELSVGIDAFAPRAPDRVVLDDDAGSGRDAPGLPVGLVALAPGPYQGTGAMVQGDLQDWYRLSVPAGSTVLLEATFTGTACFRLVPQREAEPAMSCPLQPTEGVARLQVAVDDGVWFLRVGVLAGPYMLSLSLVEE